MKLKQTSLRLGIGIWFGFMTALLPLAEGVTTQITPNRFAISEGVGFSIGANGASDFIFAWNDPAIPDGYGYSTPGASYTGKLDPTLVLTLGQTYTFQRNSGSHPFVIMDSRAGAYLTGSDGTFSRTTTDTTIFYPFILQPTAAFTADPGPTTDLISWTTASVGDFYYTCSVGSHPAMAGKIVVVPEPKPMGLIMTSLILLLVGRSFWAREKTTVRV